MILVLSQLGDKSTDDVLLFFRYFGISYFRINQEDLIDGIDIIFEQECDVKLIINKKELSLGKLDGYWYRRGKFNFKFINNNYLYNDFDYEQYKKYFLNEFRSIEDFLHKYLKSIKHINSFKDNYISKITQLYFANKHGLIIPNTIITNSLDKLEKSFSSDNEKKLIKAIDYSWFRIAKNQCEKYITTNHVVPFNIKDILDKSNQFLPTKFQTYIEKKIEIRSFYLHGKFYSMAIFSQQNKKTRLDFRNYDLANPNRNVPFKLPQSIEKKMRKTMNSLELNSGSIDLIYTNCKNYIFLEVNPIGQFDWLSKNCNYSIPMLISKYFSNDNK